MRKKISSILIFFSILLFIFSSILIFITFKAIIKKPNVENIVTNEEFIHLISDSAVDGYKRYNILPSITIAQAILESSWGKSDLSTKYKNLFGIKSSDFFKDKVTMPTFEYIDGQKIKIEASFRAYDNFEESIIDHNILIGTANRYEKVRKAKNYKEAAMALYKCGYATDPNYPQKLIEIIEQYKLYEYDVK